MHSSEWWQEQIDKTIEQIAELTTGELSGVRSVDGDEDSLVLDSMESQFKTLKKHLNFCRIEKQKALDIENETSASEIITYIPRL